MNQQVQLRLDESTLRTSLRYAFANHDTVVQELLQNARRAGATHITVGYDSKLQELFVADDGCGIADFEKLMTVGKSGWSAGVCESEKPYGMGFLAAIYSANLVSIASRGKYLNFSTTEALEREWFDVADQPAAWPERLKTPCTTMVILEGFEWQNPSAAIRRMALGFPVPIVFNGEELERPDAEDSSWHRSDVGSFLPRGQAYNKSCFVAYLQGFKVYESPGWTLHQKTVVHLNGQRYYGKFPDRDRVIDENVMVGHVEQQIKELYVERLERMRATMEPHQFCEHAYELARSLDRLDVFNDIPLIPGGWLRKIAHLPHDYIDESEVLVDSDLPAVTREQVEGNEVLIADLDDFYAGDDERVALAWYSAYALGAAYLDRHLDASHWLHRCVQVHADCTLEMEIVGQTKRELLPFGAMNYIGGTSIALCDHVLIKCDGRVGTITCAIYDPAGVIAVPVREGEAAWVSTDVLRQIDSYTDNETPLDSECEADETEVNRVVRRMSAERLEDRVALALTHAIDGLEELCNMQVTIQVDGRGKVKVLAYQASPVEVDSAEDKQS